LYFQDGRGIYVNLYSGSELRWKANGVPVTLTQKTAYPESEEIELRVNPESTVEFAVRLRIPGWLEQPARISVNGKPVQAKAERGTFAAIARRWRKGDTIALRLPFSSRTIAIEERAPDLVAAMRGPLMLTAVDPPDDLAATAQALAAMEPVKGALVEFDCATAAGKVRMRPFYRVQREPYSTYFRRTTA
jgi:DUF1680 family protein